MWLWSFEKKKTLVKNNFWPKKKPSPLRHSPHTLENKNKVWPFPTPSLPPPSKIKWQSNVKLHTKSTWHGWNKCWVASQRAHDVNTMSPQRRCNVMTLHRRYIYVMCPLGCKKGNEKYFIINTYLLDQLFHPAIHTGQYYFETQASFSC